MGLVHDMEGIQNVIKEFYCVFNIKHIRMLHFVDYMSLWIMCSALDGTYIRVKWTS